MVAFLWQCRTRVILRVILFYHLKDSWRHCCRVPRPSVDWLWAVFWAKVEGHVSYFKGSVFPDLGGTFFCRAYTQHCSGVGQKKRNHKTVTLAICYVLLRISSLLLGTELFFLHVILPQGGDDATLTECGCVSLLAVCLSLVARSIIRTSNRLLIFRQRTCSASRILENHSA